MVARPSALVWIACMAAAGCAGDKVKPRTQLIVVADTDIPSLDTIRFTVVVGQSPKGAEGDLTKQDPPIVLTLLHDQGPLGPVQIVAEGVQNGVTVVERRALVTFIEGETRVVPVHLAQRCKGDTSCTGDQTCTERGCDSIALDPEELPEWNGTPPTLAESPDAGFEDAGGDAGVDAGDAADAADAAGADADTSGFVDCGAGATSVDLMTNENHCGACDNVCKAQGRYRVPVCTDGTCGETCLATYGDCDGNEANGCETRLLTPDHCGGCDVVCDAGLYCVFGICK